MRKGLPFAAACLLASTGLAPAQEFSPAAPQKSLPDATPLVTGSPDLTRGGIAGVDVGCCFGTSAAQPLGMWVNTDYLMWWIKGAPVNTPLVTTGALTDRPPGALGQPGTRILYGDSPIGFGALSGVRLGAGIELAPGLALEGNYFLLQRGAEHFDASSDANGFPLLARPFFNNQVFLQDTVGTSDPDPKVGPWAGSVHVTSYTQLQGWELNLTSRHYVNDCWSFTALGGFRSLNLNEQLSIQENITPTTPGVLSFDGLPINPPNIMSDLDRFHTSNTFYGGQIGGRLEWHSGDFTLGLLGKVALGVNQQNVTIDGSSTMTTPGVGSITVPGGVLAQTTNIGNHYRSTFSVVPEGALNLAWNITPRIKATVGYTFMYWTQVARPGSQIDPTVNPGLIPTGSVFGNGLGAARPAFSSARETDFWAQGLNLGLEFKF
jgi:hypothetical protein